MKAPPTNESTSGNDDWSDGSLADLCSLVSDQCDPAQSDHKIYVGLEHIDSGAFALSRHGSPKDVVSAKNRFKKNDILYGKLRPYLDKAVVAEQEGICSTDILVLRPREKVCPLFALAHIHSKPFVEYAVQTTHGVNHPRTSWAALKEFQCAIPPFSEQGKIAAVLRQIQKAAEIEDAIARNARDLKKSLLRRLFTHGLLGEPLKETEIGLLPESWKLCDCESVCSMITVGIVVQPASHYVSKGVPAFRSLNIQEDRFDTSNLVYISSEANDTILSKSKLRTGDVLVVRTGYPGTSCVVTDQFDGANCIDLVILRPSGTMLSEFLSRFFNSESGRQQALNAKTGLAQQHLNVGAVKRTKVPIPSLDEQREIADILQNVDRKIDIHQSKKRSLQDLFKTMLHKLMTAQMRVNHLDIDTSEVSG